MALHDTGREMTRFMYENQAAFRELRLKLVLATAFQLHSKPIMCPVTALPGYTAQ